ncbi:MAG: DinB family protein [Bacteroidota bacterium]
MKQNLVIFGILIFCLSCSEKKNEPENKKPSELKTLLTDQLKYSHTDENWYVPTKMALNGLSTEQVNWKDSTENNSIGEIVSHLTFWNDMYLRTLKGEDLSDFEIDNDSTFLVYNEKDWQKVTDKLDSIQMEFQIWTENASKEQLSEEAFDIFTIVSHNAYHTGQIIYIRKQNGWWNRK